jgi:hypothetical protein
MSFFLAGGFPMVFVVVFGLVSLGSAVLFALRPTAGRLASVVAYATAVLLTSIAGTALDLGVVFSRFQDFPADNASAFVLMGCAEALSPVILGFSLISITALVAGIGSRRLPAA